MGAGASSGGGGDAGGAGGGGGGGGSETATVALEDARKALAEAKTELVQAVEQQHERQLELQEQQQQERQQEQHSSALAPDSAAAGQYVSARSAWQNVGTIELTAPSVEDRKTSLGATLGAAMTDTRRLIELLNCGVNSVRINMSHATREWAKDTVDALREYLHGNPGKVCALVVELAGPEARVGWLADFGDDQLRPGHECIISTDPGVAAEGSSCERFFVGHAAKDGDGGDSDWMSASASTLKLSKGVAPGTMLHIKGSPSNAASLVTLQVVECGGMVAGQEIGEEEIRCTVVRPGKLTARARVFLPAEITAELPPLSDKDLADLRWAVEAGADAVIVPCVRSAEQMEAARAAAAAATDDGTGVQMQLFAKIECAEAVAHFNGILGASDGVYIARTELAAEIGPVKAVLVQKMMIAKANKCGKPAVCGSPLLGSMCARRVPPKRPGKVADDEASLPPVGEAPELARAEVSDVVNALIDGADGLMLSYETSVGSWPIEAINRLHELCLEGESIIDSRAISARLRGDIDEPLHSQEAVAAAAVAAAHDQQAVLIVVLTGAGLMGRLVAKYHPVPPVLLVCESDRVARQAYLSRGLAPMVSRIRKRGIEAAVQHSLVLAKTVGYCQRGDNVVLVLDADLLDAESTTGAAMRAFPMD